MKAGTDLPKIAEEWGFEFAELEMADDWTLVENEMDYQSRWCTHWRKIVKHDDGLAIAIEYARDVGDGESASSYPTTWYEVVGAEKTITTYTKVEGGQKGEVSG